MTATLTIANLFNTHMSYTSSATSATSSELDTEKHAAWICDDMSINNYRKLSIDSELFFSTILNYESEEAEVATKTDQWLPLTSLRHTAHQFMIRNMVQQSSPRPNSALKPKHLIKDPNYRISTSSSFSTVSELSTISSDSIPNQLPVIPSSQYFDELCDSLSSVKYNTVPRQKPSNRERAQSHFHTTFPSDLEIPLFPSDTTSLRQRSSSLFIPTCESSESNIGLHNSKTAIQSSRKVAKLLGIDPMSNASNSTLNSKLATTSRASISSRTSDTTQEAVQSKRASLTANQIKNMVDSKLKALRRSSKTSFPADLSLETSLKSVTKRNSASIYGFVEVYKEVSGIRKRSSWKTKYLVLNASTLYRFDDNHPTSVTTTKLKVGPATIICVSNRFPGDKWVLEVGDSHCTWYLRFHDKDQLSKWLATLKQASCLTKYSKKTLPTPPADQDLLGDDIDLGNLVDQLPQPPCRQSKYHSAPPSPAFKSYLHTSPTATPARFSHNFTSNLNKVAPDLNPKFSKGNSFLNFPSLAEVPEL